MLRISKQGDYGMVLLFVLAEAYPEERWVSLKEVSQQRKVSYRFLTQIIRPLKQVGLVDAREGVNGGYRLNRSPDEITVGEALRALVGDVELTLCARTDGDCVRAVDCPGKYFWAALQERIEDFFSGVTLQDLLDRKPLK